MGKGAERAHMEVYNFLPWIPVEPHLNKNPPLKDDFSKKIFHQESRLNYIDS